MDTVLLSLRIHMVTVEPGSPADGKTLGELNLKARFGITDFGDRRGNSTTTQPELSARLNGGDAPPGSSPVTRQQMSLDTFSNGVHEFFLGGALQGFFKNTLDGPVNENTNLLFFRR
jgi:hypothetical protein